VLRPEADVSYGVDLTPEAVAAEIGRLVPRARHLLVAVSGGGDSVALLHLLAASDLRLTVGHVDHALRPDSADDAAFVAGLAKRYDLPFLAERVEVGAVASRRGWNLEEAARTLRYDLLHRMARSAGADAIAVAHTRDDQAETVLMQALRGSAYPRGMAPLRGRVVRPLLAAGRAQARALLERDGVPFRDDASNDDRGRLRSWLRHEIVPLLERRAPGVSERLTSLAAVQRDVAAFVASEAERRFGDGDLALGALVLAPPALQREAVAGLLKRHRLSVDAGRIERALDQIRGLGPRRSSLAPGVALTAVDGRLRVVGPPTEPLEPVAATEESLPEGVPASVLAALPGLVIRGVHPGDRIALAGGTRKVSDVLIDAGVPREARPGLPLLAMGSEVHWIEGIARSEALRALGVLHPDPELPAMLRALDLAERAAEAGELPVGAVVLLGGEVVGEGWNRTEGTHDPSAHAELVALRAAAAAAGDWRLGGATLVVTLEPCAMCFGAALQAHLGRIVFGADNRREGALGSVADLPAAPWKRTVEVRRGLLAPRAARLLERFFAARRGRGGERSRHNGGAE
jgi:tRNA(Ile)-lysidine synthase